MNRRRLIASLAACTLCPQVHAAGREKTTSAKKGWAGAGVEKHKLFGAHWYYTWRPTGDPVSTLEFVPMVKTASDLQSADAIKTNKAAKYLLGFNEPERKQQGNLSVDKALELWPAIEEIAAANQLPIGSPAPSSDRDGLEWLETFMRKARTEKRKIDFIAVHYYRTRKSSDLRKFIEQLAREYRRPVWLTEFNGWSGPEEEHRAFLEESLEFLEDCEDVVRYAYFNPPPGSPHALLDRNGTPTRLGRIYQTTGS